MLSKAQLFNAPTISLHLKDSDEREIRTIPQLIEYNSRHNPDHLFCVQARKQQRSISVSHFQLKQAILRCSDWLTATVKEVRLPHEDAKGGLCRGPPIALAMDSDIRLLIHLLSLLSLGVPVLLLSARLSPSAMRHLILETSAGAIIGAPNHKTTIEEMLATIPSEKHRPTFYQQEPFEAFLNDRTADPDRAMCLPHHYLEDTDRNVLILHSSGTTGMPKPIYSSHRYLLGFAACHDFVDLAQAQAPNVSTLPLFHGYGLVAPCLSLGVGMSLVLPASSSVPTGASIVELLKHENGKSLMTVPSILEDITNSDGPGCIDALIGLNFVAFGGGLVKRSVGEKLSSVGVKLLNHYGATEIGPIAPIFVPPEDYDYRFFRMRKDMELELSELPASVDGRPRYRITALPFGWATKMVVQDELVSNPQHPHSDFSAIGRNDDMIVLATGEKVIPHVLESSLSEAKDIKAVIAFGDGQFELGVIIEPRDPVNPDDRQTFVSSIWPLIVEINRRMDGHAQISAQASVIILGPGKSLPRSDKGSIMRKEAYKVFEQEISKAYQDLENSAIDDFTLTINRENLEEDLKCLIQDNLNWKLESSWWGIDDDLFELGMDSLQAVKLRRLLLSSTAVTSDNHPCRKRDFVYEHPTVSQIASALRGTATKNSEGQIQSFVDQYSIEAQPEKPNVVLLTGSTGSLGANILTHLANSPTISKVICMIRPCSDLDGFERQSQALRAQNLSVDSAFWDKIEVIQTHATMPGLGLADAEYERIQKQVTHIFHCAWPMDFKMMLPSFRGQFETLRNLLDLAVSASKFSFKRPRLLFVSSVATVGRYKSVHGQSQIPEVPMVDEKCTNAFGYGEAKLVCERMIENARLTHGSNIDVSLVRLGQITGSRNTGYWNSKEHIPAMIKSSQHIGALPRINGTLSWLPVDCAAEVLHDLIVQDSSTELVYHLENPVRQPWHEVLAMLAPLLHINIDDSMPLREWIAQVDSCFFTDGSDIANPARSLVDFLDTDFERMAGGDVKLDMSNCLKASPSLQGVGSIPEQLLAAYVDCWRSNGFLEK